ncbi:hypothetical protein MD484_g6249, partial [Candolleomyces efflorescens]
MGEDNVSTSAATLSCAARDPIPQNIGEKPERLPLSIPVSFLFLIPLFIPRVFCI